MAPAKCKDRDKICDPANARVPGCVTTICTSDTACNGGTCPMGICQGTGQGLNGTDMCQVAADCPRDTCKIPAGLTEGICTLSNSACTVSSECLYNSYIPTCSTRTCDCANPDYMPASEICTDEDCENICLLRCEEELCVTDKSCKTDTECLTLGLQVCDGGRCVECTVDKDCNEDDEETCEKGLCHKPCKQNEECGLFEECQDGDCVYVGCSSDRACILAASRGSEIIPDGETAQAITGGDDPRLSKCLPSEVDPQISTCKIPCENDGSCGQFQVCDKGYCKFVGCKDNEECRAYLGISNQVTSDAKPYVATAICRE
jgi:hypothetical protein